MAHTTLAVAPESYSLKGETPILLSIDSPEYGLHLLTNPEIPANRSSLAPRVSNNVAAPEISWRVDEQPYKLADTGHGMRHTRLCSKNLLMSSYRIFSLILWVIF